MSAPTLYLFDLVGLDLWDRKPYQPEPGTLVRKVQPYGCPHNGTMGHCYVVPADQGSDAGATLVLLNSLVKQPRRRA